MKNIKKLAFGLILVLGLATGAQATSGGGIAWDKAPGKTTDLASLQNLSLIHISEPTRPY